MAPDSSALVSSALDSSFLRFLVLRRLVGRFRQSLQLLLCNYSQEESCKALLHHRHSRKIFLDAAVTLSKIKFNNYLKLDSVCVCLVANIRPSATSVCFLSITAAHPGVESILLWRIVSIGCCPKVSPKSVAARRTSLQTVELSPRCDATGCSEDLSITYFRISKRWDRFLANLLGETLVQ